MLVGLKGEEREAVAPLAERRAAAAHREAGGRETLEGRAGWESVASVRCGLGWALVLAPLCCNTCAPSLTPPSPTKEATLALSACPVARKGCTAWINPGLIESDPSSVAGPSQFLKEVLDFKVCLPGEWLTSLLGEWGTRRSGEWGASLELCRRLVRPPAAMRKACTLRNRIDIRRGQEVVSAFIQHTPRGVC